MQTLFSRHSGANDGAWTHQAFLRLNSLLQAAMTKPSELKLGFESSYSGQFVAGKLLHRTLTLKLLAFFKTLL
jgi:hypothetical protein